MKNLRNTSDSSKERNCELSGSLERHLASYALAATAAGAGLLAIAQPAEAQIIYTPAHVLIEPGHSYHLDVNHDGAIDFGFTNGVFSPLDSFYVTPFASSPLGQNGNAVEVGFNQPFSPAALPRGAKIGASQLFYGSCIGCASTHEVMAWVEPTREGGAWINVSERYLGLRIFVNGEAHFGWARFSVRAANGRVAALLTGYAYEKTPNKPIMAGQTSGNGDDPEADAAPISRDLHSASLGVLALGAPGLALWRKDRAAGL
jgi:hypothetical protein